MEISGLFKRPERNYKVIDGIRAIAILWVIIFHVWLFQFSTYSEASQGVVKNIFLTWISRGDLGIDLFFVISGFLIGTILFKEIKKNSKINFKKFYIRRFFRIIPVYVFSMIIGVYFLKGIPGFDNWQASWSNFLFINNYITGSYLPWTWSLAIEEQFYIFIPFLIAFILPLFKKQWLFFSILAIIPIAFTYHYSVNIYHFSIPFNTSYPDDNWIDWFWNYYMLTHLRYGGLLAGVIAAHLNVFHRGRVINYFRNNTQLNSILIVIAIISFIVISSVSLGQWVTVENSIFNSIPAKIGSWYEILHREIFSYSIAFLILACIYAKGIIIKPLRYFLSLDIFYPIAQVSYSAYLFHEMFMLWYFPKAALYFKDSFLSEPSVIILNGVISVIIILFVASLMYFFIELPFQKIRDKLTLMKIKVT